MKLFPLYMVSLNMKIETSLYIILYTQTLL